LTESPRERFSSGYEGVRVFGDVPERRKNVALEGKDPTAQPKTTLTGRLTQGGTWAGGGPRLGWEKEGHLETSWRKRRTGGGKGKGIRDGKKIQSEGESGDGLGGEGEKVRVGGNPHPEKVVH